MAYCDYRGVFALGMFVSLIIFYVANLIDVVIKERREKDIK
ncbi:MAG: hypothetical protein AABW47_04025 [Nanoarchaeota archaeon]